MKIQKAASIPLVTHDPFFSIWSSADHLYDKDTVHWCGDRQRLRAWVQVDDRRYIFMGDPIGDPIIAQTGVDVTATATTYTFENAQIVLTCRFTSPILLDDMVLVSRPCTYVDLTVEKKVPCRVQVQFDVSADLVRQERTPVVGFDGKFGSFTYSMMGRLVQQPLSGSEDKITINWGYVYLATRQADARIGFERDNEKIHLQMDVDTHADLILAYDDLLSINYFGQWCKAYWTRTYSSILHAIEAAFADREQVLEKAAALDRDIAEKALAIGGESYAFLCNMSYRQTVSAHKLICDEDGNVIFLSKENDSNGCIGTVDVSYPSIPLFMLYNTEYVKGMMRPIFKFAACDAWEYDFAPHDVGRYPYAWGQVYGYNKVNGRTADNYAWRMTRNSVYPPFYMYPAGSNIFEHHKQMPVEECGNMLIMMAAVCKADGNADFAKPYMDVLSTWKDYLVKFGADPGNQLCTDDFAGHLEHNVNLSAKAIMGIEAYAIVQDMLNNSQEAQTHHLLAKEMAASWEERAFAGDHYTLAFGKPESWSLKYNLVWDKLWNSGLFSDRVYETELSYYVEKTNEYGTPLDSRRDYSKSDWIAWCAAMAKDTQQAQALLQPVAKYLENSTSRIPFGDWYDTVTGRYCRFIARSVQGGIFMPIMFKMNQNKT